MASLFTTEEIELVMEPATRLETGGMSVFTSYWFAPADSRAVPRWDLVATPPDTWDLKPGEYVPWIPLDWTLAVAHGAQEDFVIVGGWGCGKTLGLGAVGVYWCCMLPNFKFMDVGPVGWQAKQMFDAVRNDLFDWNNRDEHPRRITRLVEKIVERPYPKIVFKNGSTMEFMSADENGDKIRSWSGDAAVGDEMGLIENGLNELVGNIGSRLRGQTGGRARLGKMILMSNADYNPELWEKFDEAEINPDVAAILLTSYDNPYLTRKQLASMVRRAGSPEKARQYMLSERPLPKGLEFTESLIEKCQSEELDHIMESALEHKLPGFELEQVRKAGIIRWRRPYDHHQVNILIGDPGQANPPDRNSPVCMVFDISGFPEHPARLVAFEWLFGNGSYWPFIYKMEELYDTYKPLYAGFDATGTQKAFDELVFTQRGPGRLFAGLDVSGQKQAMVVALKLLMGQGLIEIPKSLKSVWLQLANWHMPDTKLRQDIAACLFMVGQTLHQVMAQSQIEDDSEELNIESYDRNDLNRALVGDRNAPMRE